MRQLCASVAPHLPDFVLESMVLQLLQVDLQAGEAVGSSCGGMASLAWLAGFGSQPV